MSRHFLSIVLLAAFAGAAAAGPSDPLAAGFAVPPRDSRPETWFHLIGGNVSKPGLTADLEAIAGAGLSGIQLFHGGSKSGAWPGVTPQIECLSPSWDEMIRHAADESRRLGLRFTMQNCPGWSQSGGPWIKPENAMRHLVWSRTDVAGGANVSQQLARPEPSKEPWRDYRDVAVIAFPTPDGDDGSYLQPTGIRSNRGNLAWTDLVAGKPDVMVNIASVGEPAWVEMTFAGPVTLRSLELPPVEKLTVRRAFDPAARLRVQAVTSSGLVDVVWREIPRGNWQDDRPLTLALPETTASGFRITFENKTPLALSALRLSSAARIDDWLGQAGFVLRSLDRTSVVKQSSAAWVSRKSILDLTKCIDAGGRLAWQAPAGRWTILRFGHVNTGQKNGPAPPEATGFECDKLSAAGAEAHFAGYIGRLSAPGGPADDGRMKGMVIDSWECHTQTWTPAMESEFAARRGYALRNWLPALAGWVMDDQLTSERFLRDWRATLSDLLVSNYYGRLAALGHERGMTLSFESGPGDVAIGDILQDDGQADIPMCEFWRPNDPHLGGLETKPMMPAVSAAHIYGKKRIAAEAFTNIALRWDEHPFMMKNLADRHFAMGLNHLVLHTYTHNPRLDVVPGTSFGSGIGTPHIRGQTWWHAMPAWTNYIARCSFLLEQGRPVADVLRYLGDDVDHKPRSDEAFPAGYKYDYLNAEVLLGRLAVKNGLLETPEGVRWKVLWLPGSPRLTVDSLSRIRDLVKQGATVVGMPSMEVASLSGGEGSFQQFSKVFHELWGDNPATEGERDFGSGRLLWGCELSAAFSKIRLAPDVTGAKAATWCHREMDGTDIYFIAGDRAAPLNANLEFRSGGRPEFWDPLTGIGKPVSVFHRPSPDRTVVPIELPAAGSVFLIFRPGKNEPAFTKISRNGITIADATDAEHVDTGKIQAVQGLKGGMEEQPWVENPLPSHVFTEGGKRFLAWEPGSYQLTEGDGAVTNLKLEAPRVVPLAGPWTLSFPKGWDAPDQVDLPSLQPWSELSDAASRAFSGTATYACEVKLEPLPDDARVMLDLGRVAVIAEVSVNGKPVRTMWSAPFRSDITQDIRPGENRIEVKVTNTWFNRLAYDASMPNDQRKTWTIHGPAAGSLPQLSGLTGPVVLRIGQAVLLKP